MINQLQHIMILALYTFFSVFISVICITFSDSFNVGIIGFFIAFILSVCAHIFWIGKIIVGKMSVILYDVEDGTNLYQQELKTVRDIIDNITNIINTIINDNEQLQSDLQNTQQNMTDTQSTIEKIQNLLSEQMNQLQNTATQLPSLNAIPLNNTQHHHQDGDLAINKLIPQKEFVTSPQAHTHINNLNTSNNPAGNQNFNEHQAQEETDFLNLTQDSSFKDLNLPEEDFLYQPNPSAEQIQSHDLNIQNTENNQEFATIKKLKNNLDHPPQDLPYIEKTPHQDKKIYDFESEIHTPKIKISNNDIEENEYFDITTDLKQSSPLVKEHKQTIPSRASFDDITETTEIPSFNNLVPEHLIKKIPQRKNLLETQNSIPSLDMLLDNTIPPSEINETQPLLNSKIPPPERNETRPLSNRTKFDNMYDEEWDITTDTKHPSNQEAHSKKNETSPPLKDIIEHTIIHKSLEVFIQPISNFNGNSIKFFETYAYLPHQNKFIEPENFLQIAKQHGYIDQIETLLFEKTIHILRQIIFDIPEASVFCNISVASFSNQQTTNKIIQIIQKNSDIAHHVIFEFSQQNLQELNSKHIETMHALRNYGIRFSVDNIMTDLPDLFELSHIGISFLKIKPHDFIKGIVSNNTLLQEDAIKSICHKSNIMLCVEEISDIQTLELIKPYMPDLLQGNLLGTQERAQNLGMT